MKRKTGLIVAVAVTATLVAGGVGLVAWQPWAARDADGIAGGDTSMAGERDEQGNERAALEDHDAGGSAAEKTGNAYDTESDEGVIKRGDFDSDEDYRQAVVEAGKRRGDLPRERVDVPEGGPGCYWMRGWLTVQCRRSAGKQAAQGLVAELGGEWGSDTYAWNTGLATAQVEAYFPEAKSTADLRELIQELIRHEDIVAHAQIQSGGGLFSSGNHEATDPLLESQYALELCHFDEAWGECGCDGEVEIAVVDTGVDLDHEDFVLADNTSLVTAAYDAYDEEDMVESNEATSTHGTAVAGIACAAAGNGSGIAGASFNARLVPVRASIDLGDGSSLMDLTAVMRAFEYLFALPNRPEVINMSFGRNYLVDPFWLNERHFQELVDQARGYGIVCVAAVGNDGDSTSYLPARLDGVVGVGAVDEDSVVRNDSNRNPTVDIVAPGDLVLTTVHPDYSNNYCYDYHSQTSMAAPFVSAAAALLKAAHPGWSADQVEQRLEASARKVSGMGGADRTDAYGYGVLDAYAALSGTVTTAASPNTGGSLAELYARQAGKVGMARGAFGRGSGSR